MESNKKFGVTIALILLIIICLLFYYFVIMSDNTTLNMPFSISNLINRPQNNNTTNNTINNTNDESSDQISFGVVNDYQIYFNINSLINKYYMEITNGNYKQVLGMLDDYYIKSNNITGSNITNFITTGYQNITFYSKSMYMKSNKKLAYYFVDGEEQLYSFTEQKLTEKEHVTYLVTVDKVNDTFGIMPIATKTLADYARNYTISSKKEITANAYNSYFIDSISDEIICSYYINYFKTMLYLNSEKAYNMLDSDYKNTFIDYEDFVNNLQSIYEKLNTKIMNYAIKGDNGKRIYSTISENSARIRMTENSILNFKISIEKSK